MKAEVKRAQQKFLAENLKNKTVAIGGATGLIGARAVKYLLELNETLNANIKILALCRNREKFNRIYKNYKDNERISFVCFDEKTLPDAAASVDYALCCAGISGGTKMHLKEPVRVFDVAYGTAKNFLDFAVASGVKKVCFVSTYEIYGTPENGELIKENAPCSLDTTVLRNIYSECKRMQEAMCTAYSAQHKIETVCGRLTSTFGYGVSYDDPRFFAEFARCAVSDNDIVLKSSGATVRSYLDSDDAAAAFLYLLVCGKNLNVYNVTNMDNKLSVKEIAEKVIKISKTKAKLRFDIAEDAAALGFRKEGVTLMDAEKLYDLGFEPVYSIDDTIGKLIDEIRNGAK